MSWTRPTRIATQVNEAMSQVQAQVNEALSQVKAQVNEALSQVQEWARRSVVQYTIRLHSSVEPRLSRASIGDLNCATSAFGLATRAAEKQCREPRTQRSSKSAQYSTFWVELQRCDVLRGATLCHVDCLVAPYNKRAPGVPTAYSTRAR